MQEKIKFIVKAYGGETHVVFAAFAQITDSGCLIFHPGNNLYPIKGYAKGQWNSFEADK